MESGGIDLGFFGMRYTWNNGRRGMACIKEMLDRVVAHHSWTVQFPKAIVEHLPTECSDHCPILLKTEGVKPYINVPFQFIKAWASDKDSENVVQKAWNKDWKDFMECHQLRRSLFNTSKALRSWNKDHIGIAQTRIKNLKDDSGRIN